MAISGLNFTTTSSFANLNRASEAGQSSQQNSSSNSSRQINAINSSNPTGGPQTVSQDGTQVTSGSSIRIPAPSQADQANRAVTSRRNPAETEAFASQFRLQRESGQGNSQVREFISVANFEQRDQLAQNTGIDVFV